MTEVVSTWHKEPEALSELLQQDFETGSLCVAQQQQVQKFHATETQQDSVSFRLVSFGQPFSSSDHVSPEDAHMFRPWVRWAEKYHLWVCADREHVAASTVKLAQMMRKATRLSPGLIASRNRNSPRPFFCLFIKYKTTLNILGVCESEYWCLLCAHCWYNVFFRHLVRIYLRHFHCSLHTCPLLKQSEPFTGMVNPTFPFFFGFPAILELPWL